MTELISPQELIQLLGEDRLKHLFPGGDIRNVRNIATAVYCAFKSSGNVFAVDKFRLSTSSRPPCRDFSLSRF